MNPLNRPLSAALIWLALHIAGCETVGPDYIPPEIRSPAAWNSPLGTGISSGASDSRILAEWWKVFEDPILSELIERAVAGNSDIKKAKSRIREAGPGEGSFSPMIFPRWTRPAR